MEHLRSFGMYIGGLLGFHQKPILRENTRIDAYFNVIYKILTWEQPKLSSIILMVFHILLWLIVQLEIKFYGVIFITILTIVLGDYYLEGKNFQIENEEPTELMRQMVCYISDIVTYLKTIRRKYPMPFCVVTCMLFLCLTVIARNVSGVTLTYLGLIGIFVGPAIISRLPVEYVESFKEWSNRMVSNQGVLAESELIPFLTIRERDTDLDSLQTDKTMDSITDSLISGITSMPSYLEADKDIDDDLELPYRLTRESSTDTDSDRKSMNFESSHFNGDSSSDDENRYGKGLTFSDVTKDLPTSTGTTGILTNLTTLGSNLLTNVLKTKSKGRDSDSDFEIIDSDEVADS